MNFVILTIVVLYTIALAFTIKKRKKEDEKRENDFWAREHDANFTRKKSIDELDYITIPENILQIADSSMNLTMKSKDSNVNYDSINVDQKNGQDENSSTTENKEPDTSCQTIKDLSSKKILNLNGITNTELKLDYGAANLTALSEYDQNFSDLIVALDNLGKLLSDNDKNDDATIVLEYAVKIHTDILTSYTLLSDLYIMKNKKELIHLLIKNSEELNSLRKNAIIRHLNEKLDQ